MAAVASRSSSVMTEPAQGPSHIHVTLHLASTPQEKTLSLLSKMSQSSAFSREEQGKLLDFPRDFIDFSTEDTRKKTAIALCKLLYDVIYPAEDRNADDPNLSAFETELKESIGLSIPPGTDVETYLITNYEKFVGDAREMAASSRSVNALYLRKRQEMYTMANQMNGEIQRISNESKNRILQVVDKREADELKLQGEWNLSTTKVDDLGTMLQDLSARSQDHANRMAVGEDEIKRLVADFQVLLGRVRS